MLEQPNLPVSVNIQVDDRYMERFAKAYLDELYQKVLKPEWLTIADLEHITRHKRAWIMEYIVDDPYVRRNGIAKKRVIVKMLNGYLMPSVSDHF
ncbi:DUF771 domain-containing protein [Enterococcus faecium]|uniref:DUF771 domain-containing protein n=1 Tax=Enterococcus faecium TaxID=1352 RepID=UPI001D0DC7FF|nr:DUF771 domain-containing protein [Enterococcus faecium]